MFRVQLPVHVRDLTLEARAQALGERHLDGPPPREEGGRLLDTSPGERIGDYRESQNSILSQDFGSFFNEAFPLPDLDSPFPNFNDSGSPPTAKKDLIAQVDHRLEAKDEEEVVPGEDRSQMMDCTKIWLVVLAFVDKIINTCCYIHKSDTPGSRDRLQSMEKFRNGEIDQQHGILWRKLLGAMKTIESAGEIAFGHQRVAIVHQPASVARALDHDIVPKRFLAFPNLVPLERSVAVCA